MAQGGPELVCHVGPITALTVCSQKIVWGCGSEISVFDLVSNSLLARQQILHGATVHGISLGPTDGSHCLLLCVYGAKQARIISFDCREDTSDVVLLSDIKDFNDWIWDVHWLTDQPVGGSIAVALAHNVIVRWEWNSGKISHQRECSEKCILYCARFIGSCWDSLILAAGTVFNQVVLWPVACPDQNTDSQIDVIHTLSGHQGVIFSIQYNNARQMLFSVSDDRSIRMWQLTFQSMKSFEPDLLDWRSVKSDLVHVLYGHSARVWDIAFTSAYFASVGEDAACFIWNYDGKILHKFTGHKGRSIWALAVTDDEKCVITGGGDGSIRMWEVECEKTNKTVQRMISIPQSDDVSIQDDFPRTVRLLNFDLLLIMMNSGNCYSYNISDQQFRLIVSDSHFRSYSIVSPGPDQVTVALGSITGVVQVIHMPDYHDEEIKYTQTNLFSGKVLALAWLDECHLLASGPNGFCILLKITTVKVAEMQDVTITPVYCLSLPPCKHRWITAACFVPVPVEGIEKPDSLVVCGDKDGSVYCYIVSDKSDACVGAPLEQSECLKRVHGKAGVTSVCWRDGCIYTTGRDGFYRQWELKGWRLTQLRCNRVVKGFDWIDRLEWYHGDLLVYGFFSSQFMVWSVSFNQQLMSVHCGGGHRAWGCCHDNDMIRFAYLKTGEVFLVESGHQSKQRILQTALHGRELCDVKFMKVLSDKNDNCAHVVCTGSEDTTISVGAFVNVGKFTSWKPLSILKGHLSSVRTLALSPSVKRKIRSFEQTPIYNTFPQSDRNTSSKKSRSDFLLFSGGGRAEIRAWAVSIFQGVQENRSKISKDYTGSKNDSSFDKVQDINIISPSEDGGTNIPAKSDKLPTSDLCDDILRKSPSFIESSSISNLDSSNQVHCDYQHLSTHFLKDHVHGRFHQSSRKLKLDPETRIMSLDVLCLEDVWNKQLWQLSDKNKSCTSAENMKDFSGVHVLSCAGSDGLFRVLVFHEESRTFQQLADSSFHRGCVLKTMHYVHYFNTEVPVLRSFAVSASTNGDAVFWSLDQILAKFVSDSYLTRQARVSNEREHSDSGSDDESPNFKSDDDTDDGGEYCGMEGTRFKNLKEEKDWEPVAIFKAHQSGVNSLHLLQISESDVLLASGGDDNAISVHLLSVSDVGIELLAKTTKEDAHAAQVTGTHLLSSSLLVSASIDQRICVWSITQTLDKQIQLQMVACKYIDVADVSNLAVYLYRNSIYLTVAGEGLCLYRINAEGVEHCLTQDGFHRERRKS